MKEGTQQIITRLRAKEEVSFPDRIAHIKAEWSEAHKRLLSVQSQMPTWSRMALLAGLESAAYQTIARACPADIAAEYESEDDVDLGCQLHRDWLAGMVFNTISMIRDEKDI